MSNDYRVKSKTNHLDLINRSKIVFQIEVMKEYKYKRDKALIAFLYLTGCRVSEVVKKIKKYDLDYQEILDQRFLVVNNVECLKRKEGNFARRNIAIHIEKEKDFVRYIIDWLKYVKSDEVIFDISRQQAYNIVRKFYDPAFPHYLRHLRLSHLTTLYGMNSAELRHFTGWTSDKPAAHYVHLNWQDIARKMI